MVFRLIWILLPGLFLLSHFEVASNNLSMDLEGLSDGEGIKVQVEWEDSWHYDEQPPFNHDAVWLFVKYRDEEGSWNHRYLSNQAEDYDLNNGNLQAEPVEDRAGVFLRKADKGASDVSSGPFEVPFEEPLTGEEKGFRVFGIEMVYIPESSFYLGDGKSQNSFQLGETGMGFLIDGENEIPVGSDNGELNSIDNYAPEDDIPATFPNGYSGFYVMKSPITQGQYKDFLNTLEFRQQDARTTYSPDGMAGAPALNDGAFERRNHIFLQEPGEAQEPAVYAMKDQNENYGSDEDGRHRACNFLKWNDLAAYLDWAGLRPMTSLEYEKAARGPKEPVPGAFAWGTPYAVNAENVLHDGTEKEQVQESANDSAGLTLHGYDGVRGALRPGFAGPGEQGRLATGSSYYGIFDLSGNVWEMVVNTQKEGLDFKGLPGNGILTEEGEFTLKNWPGNGQSGAGFKGGGWNSGIFPVGNFRDLAVSDRFYSFQFPANRRETSGGRGARSK